MLEKTVSGALRSIREGKEVYTTREVALILTGRRVTPDYNYRKNPVLNPGSVTSNYIKIVKDLNGRWCVGAVYDSYRKEFEG